MSKAYYNEFDSGAAAWLRELIRMGAIADGDVDERSIEDVYPSDLHGYTQCHFFAGIGGWSYALRLAGWPDDRSVWTGSCPCQPFSSAGKGAAFADERHLWPAFLHLIKERKPSVVLGEQVASKDADAWIDLVQADLEGLDYAVGAVPFPSAGVGAPHIRDRLYWVAHSDSEWRHNGRRMYRGRAEESCRQETPLGSELRREAEGIRSFNRLGNADLPRLEGLGRGHQAEGGRHGTVRPVAEAGELGGFADPNEQQRHGSGDGRPTGRGEFANDRAIEQRPGPTNGFWRAADWLLCRDGKWRPVSASPQPLADGVSESLGRVRDESVKAIEEEVNEWEMERKIGRSEALRDLWNAAREASPRIWEAGGIPGLHEAPFLLAFMRQLAKQGWGIQECIPVSGKEVPEGIMRVLWSEIGTSCTPCGRGLEEQRRVEYSDALRVLSSILARHAYTAWEVAHSAYAESCFPLVRGAKNRVMRLRGYGNAINPVQAALFVEVFMESMSCQK